MCCLLRRDCEQQEGCADSESECRPIYIISEKAAEVIIQDANEDHS